MGTGRYDGHLKVFDGPAYAVFDRARRNIQRSGRFFDGQSLVIMKVNGIAKFGWKAFDGGVNHQFVV